MRKHIISVCLLSSLSLFVNAQSWEADMIIARKMVDSLKNELKTAKGDKRIDCLNLLSQTYDWIWDDNIKHLDSSCMYSDQAYELTKNGSYKRGLGYANLGKANCYGSRMDDNRNNNNSEPNYVQANKLAQQAIQVGEEIKDYRLVGDAYNMLRRIERWEGDPAKFKDYVQKAIVNYEKPVKNKLTGLLNISRCDQCQGNEKLLGGLYQILGTIGWEENNPLLVRESMNKAIHYYNMIGSKRAIGSMYSSLRQANFRMNNYKESEEAALKALAYFQEANDKENEIREMNEMCKEYEITGDFEKGLFYGKKSIQIAELLNKNRAATKISLRSSGLAFFWLCRLYIIAGDYETALNINRRGRNFYPDPIDSTAKALWSAQIGDVHRLLGNYDSALYYLKPFEKTPNDGNNFGKIALGFLYLDLKEYDKALQIADPFYTFLKRFNRSSPPQVNCLMIAGNALYAQQKYSESLEKARLAQAHLKKMDGRVLMITNYKLLSDIFSKLNINDSAYYYLKLHTSLKDSLINRQLYFRLNTLKSESEEQKKTSLIQLLQKDNVIKEQLLQEELLRKRQNEAELALLDQNNKIKDQELLIKEHNLKEQTLLKDQNLSKVGLLDKENKLKDQRLKQQATIRNALLAGLLLFVALGIFVFRTLSLNRKNERLQNEKRQAELQQKASELEMQALRAQMNPHFIFNCLSSINKFILKNDTDTASDYLTRFSRLIRQTLTHSQLSLIPLSDEIEMLRLYLDMERLRFSDSFIYNITYENSIEPETVYVPPMLLQPFCENAIWHGLMHKEGSGKLEVILGQENGQLRCIIADNGIGRAKAAEWKSKSNGKQKSLGLKITTERLALFNDQKSIQDFCKTEDILDATGNVAGTKVVLNVNLKNAVHQPVKETV